MVYVQKRYVMTWFVVGLAVLDSEMGYAFGLKIINRQLADGLISGFLYIVSCL